MIEMYWWARQYPVTDMAKEAQIEFKVVIDIYQWLREVCSISYTLYSYMILI